MTSIDQRQFYERSQMIKHFFFIFNFLWNFYSRACVKKVYVFHMIQSNESVVFDIIDINLSDIFWTDCHTHHHTFKHKRDSQLRSNWASKWELTQQQKRNIR